MGIEIGVFLTFGGTLILVFLLGKTLLVPIKILLKILLNSILGAILIIVFNFIGVHIGVVVPFNVVNSLIIGVLGLPGAIILIILCN